MVRVRLKGSPQTQWNIDGSFKPGYDPIQLSEQQVIKNKLIIEEILDEEFKSLLFKEIAEESKPIIQPKQPIKKSKKGQIQ